MKKTLLNILLGASLFFGAGNKTKAQECMQWNHDNDEFPEEIICWRKDGFNVENLKPNQNIADLTIIYYSDKDNDNFHENIIVFNYDDKYSDFEAGYLASENFNIDKKTGIINYVIKSCNLNKILWNRFYSKKTPFEIVVGDIPEAIKKSCTKNDYFSLTKEQIYSLFPGFWTFYGGFGERVKKIINSSENETKLKEMVNNEREAWGYILK